MVRKHYIELTESEYEALYNKVENRPLESSFQELHLHSVVIKLRQSLPMNSSIFKVDKLDAKQLAQFRKNWENMAQQGTVSYK